MDYNKALKLVGLAEGRWTNDPDDSGGMTACGIARNKNPHSKIWPYIDRLLERGCTLAQVENIAREDKYFMDMVAAFYRGLYWNACRCDDIPGILRYPVFSCSVNCGPKIAIKLLQKALSISADGLFGPMTYRALRLNQPAQILPSFITYWHQYYDDLVTANPYKYSKYINGWHNRISNVLENNE